jgi:hypothetical protein
MGNACKSFVGKLESKKLIGRPRSRWEDNTRMDLIDFYSRRGLGIFLFTTASKTAMGPTQLPIQLVQVALSLGVKRPESEADHSPPSSVEVKELVELHLHSPNMPPWRGAKFKKSTGTTLPYLGTKWPLIQTFKAKCLKMATGDQNSASNKKS